MEKVLEEYLEYLKDISEVKNYEKPESFINLPIDESNVTKVLETLKKSKSNILKEIVVIGIGGSSLGAKAVYDSINQKRELGLKIHFLDQVNEHKISKVAKRIQKEKVENCLIIVITKSGKTFETRKNLELLKKELNHNKNYTKVFITEKESEFIKKESPNFILTIPEKVGGRFSVFSPVGLYPLGSAELDIVEFLKGGMKGRKETLTSIPNKTTENAERIWKSYLGGKGILNIFIFSPELMTLGKWYQQLIGESLGKNSVGLFPVVSEGSKDLHSLQQYFMEGKQNVQHEIIISHNENRYQRGLCEALEKTYREHNIEYNKTELISGDLRSIGEFMQNKFFEVLFLGKLLKVNPFGQSGVESYKNNLEKFLI